MNSEIKKEDLLNKINKCECFPYNGKKNLNNTSVFLISAILILLIILGNLILIYKKIITINTLWMTLLPSLVIIFAYIIKKMQFDTMKTLTQYFKDEDNIYYKIQFTKTASKPNHVFKTQSNIPLVGELKTLIDSYELLKKRQEQLDEEYEEAQDKICGYYYVDRFKKGIIDWNIMTGGEAKVIKLGKLKKIHGKRYTFDRDDKKIVKRIPTYYNVN